jgi:hypothetical protein
MKVSSQKMGLAVSTTVAPTARLEFFRHSSRTYIAFFGCIQRMETGSVASRLSIITGLFLMVM